MPSGAGVTLIPSLSDFGGTGGREEGREQGGESSEGLEEGVREEGMEEVVVGREVVEGGGGPREGETVVLAGEKKTS